MLRTGVLESKPDGHPSPVGSKSRGKKLHTGFTSPEAVEIPNSAFHTQESCSPICCGTG